MDIHHLTALPRRRQAGVAMTEFLIISPLAIMVILAIVQLGFLYAAKSVLNEATFLAARAGSVNNAKTDAMWKALETALIPFYQNSTIKDARERVFKAGLKAKGDLIVPAAGDCRLNACLEKLTLRKDDPAFDAFGVKSDIDKKVYIPNDSLEHRLMTVKNGQTIQDANVLRIKVTYAYELKVPLMGIVMKAIMCSIDSGVNAFGRGDGLPTNCNLYYLRGRVPITSYATVQMHSDAVRE